MTMFAMPAAFEAATPLFRILPETAADAGAREKLLDAAMGPERTRKSSEAIRRGRLPAEGLAFAAKDAAGTLVGTVRLWNIAAGRAADKPVPALLLGPLAVDPSLKNAGIGSALMRHAIAEAARLGHGAIVLVGDPEYYAKFGFDACLTGALSMPGPFERHRLLALELKAGALNGAEGLVRPTGVKVRTTMRAQALAA